jgi:L-methionine (R)-S-oxide reductase
MPEPFDFDAFLGEALAAFACQTGTIHRTAADGRTLEMVACRGLPDPLLEKIARIPFGKGIAGVAAETREPVELCNLQQDLGGVAKPGARATGVSGSLAVPVFAPTGAVAGTLGVGMAAPHDFTGEEKQRLAHWAERLAPHLLDGR